MEARKITVVSTKTQKKSVIMSGAETLEELKRDLTAAGIDFEDMTFYEGTSKTELKTNESILPKDVPYTNRTTGETKITNELVFMLTNTNKKIRSGAVTRAEVYATIKANNLQQACIERYGKNFTLCSTDDLMALIADMEEPEEEVVEVATGCVDFEARAAIRTLVEALYEDDVIDVVAKEDTLACLSGNKIVVNPDTLPSSYSDSEIEEMFDGVC